MKGMLIALCAFVLGVVMLTISPSAKATGPIDCTGGCEIVTCDTTYCTVWHCDSGGCLIVGGYYKTKGPPRPAISQGFVDKPAAFDAVCEVQGNKPCAIKTCANGSCSIQLFNGKAFVPVGQVQDVDRLIDQANAKIKNKH